ncbi:MAG: hypothetical protein NZ700_07430 [Gemmataceae bacterium]|nr:hypothetical protein [Gemmataceae bacterium]MDW8266015.1 hypothetical protein [Gemmataceae bacterium]
MSSYGNSSYAAQRVQGPATALLVTAIVGVVMQVLALGYNLVIAGAGAAAAAQAADPQQALELQWMSYLTGTTAVVSAVIGVAIGALVIWGALKMKSLQSYGLAVASSVLAMIPCISPCCLLGLPFGIWSLVVLNDPQVKSAFH